MLPSLRVYKEEKNSEFIQVSGPLYREKAIYDDSHLTSLNASHFQVPEPIQGVKLGIFLRLRAYMGGGRMVGIFPSPKAYMKGKTRKSCIRQLAPRSALLSPNAYTGGEPPNFPKSQNPSHIPSYFLRIFSYVLHISSYFLHISSLLLRFHHYSKLKFEEKLERRIEVET